MDSHELGLLTELSKVYRKQIAVISLLSVAMFGVFLGVVFLITKTIKEDTATHLIPQVRRYLLIGDIREAQLACVPLSGTVFESIVFLSSDKSLVFSAPDIDTLSEKSLRDSLAIGVIETPISLGHNDIVSGYLVFKYRRFAHLPFALGLCVIWLGIAAWIVRSNHTKMQAQVARTIQLAKVTAVAQMAEALAHDIKNSLITIEFGIKAQHWSEFQELKLPMSRSVATIRAILADVGKPSDREVINVAETLFDFGPLLATLGKTAESQDFKVAFLGPQKLRAILDPVGLERVLHNLVQNALEAKASWVQIEVQLKAKDLEITVADNGPGIPAAILKNLFARGATYGKPSGKGLGLSNVRTIVEKHGGTVSYLREKGLSKFRLMLPNAVLDPNFDSDLNVNQRSILEPGDMRSQKVNAESSGCVLVALADKTRVKAVVDHLQSQHIPTSSMDSPAGKGIAVVCTDDEQKLEQYLETHTPTIFDDGSITPEKLANKITQAYRYYHVKDP